MASLPTQPTTSRPETIHEINQETIKYGVARLSKLLTPENLKQFTELKAEDLKVFINFCLISPREDWVKILPTDKINSIDSEVILAMGGTPSSDMTISINFDSDFYEVPNGVSLQNAFIKVKKY